MQLRGSKQAAVAGGAVIAALAIAACSSSSSSSTSSATASSGASSPAASSAAASGSGTINAAGSSFQNTFQEGAIAAFKSVNSGITVNYDSVGSGTGRSDLYSNTVLMAGSDSPIPASEQSKVPAGKTVLYFPVVIGPITLSYNLSGISNLKLSPTVIANIFQGNIKTWNDPAIKAINPGVSLPSTAITTRGPLGLLWHHAELHAVPAERRAQRMEARQRLHHQVAVHGPRRRPERRRGVDHQVDARCHRLRRLLHRQGLQPDLRVGAEQGRRLRRAVTDRFLRGRGGTPRSRRTSRSPRPTSSSAPTAYPITYQSWDLVYAQQPNANDAAMLKAYLGYLLGDRPAAAATLVLRAAAVQPRPEGRGAAEPDHLLLRMTFMTQASVSLTGLFS